MEKKNIIYGLKSNGKFHYIGKTHLNDADNIETINPQIKYFNPNTKPIFQNEDSTTVILHDANEDWYDDKLQEVVNKYKEGNPLKNAQFMLDGNRGYWSNKTRDANTLNRLSESKHKKVCQYDANGNLIKKWQSVKEAAINVFNDYEIIKGSGNSYLYSILDFKYFHKRLYHSSYWIREEELIKHFGIVPKRININKIKEYEINLAKENRKTNYKPRTQTQIYTVNHYDNNGKLIATYDNIHHAAYKLKTYSKSIERLCNGSTTNDNYIIKYGLKKLQPINQKYPKHISKPLERISSKKKYQKTRTNITVIYDVDGNTITFDSIKDAANHFKTTVRNIYYRCYNDKHNLKFGCKKQVMI